MRILVQHGDQRLGPFTREEAQQALAAGIISASDLAWQEGTPSWIPFSALLSGAADAPVGVPANAPQTSGTAIASLVLGITSIGLCLSALSGIPAIICGHMARAQIRKSGGALTGSGMALGGLITGYLGTLIFPLILLAIALPAFMKTREQAKSMATMNHARQIVTACQSYSFDHEGNFPERLEQLIPDHLDDRKVLADPQFTNPDPSGIGFHYYGGKNTDPEDKVLLASKGTQRGGQRVVGRVNGQVELARFEPPPER